MWCTFETAVLKFYYIKIKPLMKKFMQDYIPFSNNAK